MAVRDAQTAGIRPISQTPSPSRATIPYHPPTSSRDSTLRASAAQSPPNAPHWHVVPASFLILGFMGSGLSPGEARSWLWIAALALNVIARLAIPGDPSPAVRRADSGAASSVRWRAVSYLTDAMLWTGLVLSIDPLPGPMATRVGGSLAAAILISSLSSASRSTPLGLALGWAVPVLAIAMHAASGLVIALGLFLWIASVVWLGATRPAPPPQWRTRIAPAANGASGSTRRGVQMAVQISSAPMMAVYGGRVFEINPAAAAILATSDSRQLLRSRRCRLFNR